MDQIQAMNQIGGQPRPTFSKYHNAYSTSGFDMLGVLVSRWQMKMTQA